MPIIIDCMHAACRGAEKIYASPNNNVRRIKMAFKITAKDQKRVEALFGELDARRATLEDAVNVFNETLAAERAKLQEVVDLYNEKSNELRGVLEDIHSEMEDEFDNKSDNWKASDKADVIEEWIGTINEIVEDVNEASLASFPETLDMESLIEGDPQTKFALLDKAAPDA